MSDKPPTIATAWLDELGRRLPRHASVLRRLVDGVRADARVVQLVVACSIGRGAGDELSDLDCALSLEPEAWPSGLELVEPLVCRAGDVVELLHHAWPEGSTSPQRRTAVQYRNGVQLDLMVWPVTVWSGLHPPDTVVLYATRDVFTRGPAGGHGTAGAEQVFEWWFLGWWALLDADKYLRRGSPWEAQQRLHEARTAVFRLAAAAQGLPSAEYGVTALLDAAEPRVPDGMDGTLAGTDAESLRAAIRRCGDLLDREWAALGRDTSQGLGPWARGRLGGW